MLGIDRAYIDNVILRKLKLRVIELKVAKLKHFVKVPVTIGKFNVFEITTKTKAFDIKDEYLPDCCNALNFCKKFKINIIQ